MEIAGKRALVTGATGGIGQAIARALHDAGATVVVTGRRKEVLDELVASLGGGDRAEALVADVGDAAAARKLIDDAGDLDILVVNHALPASGRLDDFSEEEVPRQIDVNLTSPIVLAHALVPKLIEKGAGHLVFISSISGKVAAGGSTLYSATKFGLRGFATSLHAELLDQGVGVTTVYPGFISDAGMFHDADVTLPPGVSMRSPEQVATAVIQGIEKNRSEIDVAPITLRSGAWLAGISQSTVQRIQKIAGGDKVSADLAAGQRDKRS